MVCDVSKRGRADAADKIPTAAVTGDLQELLDAGLDAVLVLTPDNKHALIALETLKAGIPTFCEKPLDVTLEAADAILTTAFETGTRLYVPVIFNDNSLPIIGDFPPTGDREALIHYIFSQEQLGVEYARITIDGQTTSLGPKHVVQVAVPSPLPDGATDYQAIAAILTPLQKGTHTVEISGRASGDALSEPPFPDFFLGGFFEFSTTYTVIVD